MQTRILLSLTKLSASSAPKSNVFSLKLSRVVQVLRIFLIFYQDKQPVVDDTPLYAIEETKTDDKESRNTGVYQRCSKFVFIQNFIPRQR